MDTMELYSIARNKYAKIGIDTDDVIDELTKLSISIDCGLGDKVDTSDGKHVNRVMNLRNDIDKALTLIPGMHRINIDARCYITDDIISLDELSPRHFDGWINWGRTKVKGIDITSSMSNHEMSDTGYTLSSDDKGIRYYWIEHACSLRKIGEKLGRELISPSYVNIQTFDKQKVRDVSISERQKILTKSLDKIYNSSIDDYYVKDIISGASQADGSGHSIASELLCHQYSRKQFTIPQVDISGGTSCDKLHMMMSNACYFSNNVAVKVLAGNGENVLNVNEAIQKQIDYIVGNDLLDTVQLFIGLSPNRDNRMKQWVISARSLQRAVMKSLLTPKVVLDKCDEYMRAALSEEFATYPMSAVWDYFCLINDTPVGIDYLEDIK